MSNWEAGEFQAGDERHVLRLFQSVFGHERSLAHWIWEFLDCPAGRGITYLARAGNRVVGQYTVVPVEMVARGKTILGAQSVDTMTATDFRRQGIFEGLARLTFERCRKLGVDLVYGFPNQNSYQGFVSKLGFESVASVREFRFRLDWKRLIADRRPKSVVRSLATEYIQMLRTSGTPVKGLETVQSFTEEHDELWKRVSKTIALGVAKTSAYLSWRYLKRPHSTYRIFQIRDSGRVEGVAVWKCEPEWASLVDMITDTDLVEQQLLRAIVKEAKKAGCHFLRGWVLDRGLNQKSLFESFPIAAEPTVLISKSPTGALAVRSIRSAGDWRVHWGDSDGI